MTEQEILAFQANKNTAIARRRNREHALHQKLAAENPHLTGTNLAEYVKMHFPTHPSEPPEQWVFDWLAAQ